MRVAFYGILAGQKVFILIDESGNVLVDDNGNVLVVYTDGN